MLIAHLCTRSRVFRFSFSRPRRTMSMSMSMWSLRWHFTNKTVTGAPYSIKSYSLSHSWTLGWRVRWLKHAVPSWGRGGTAAAMAQRRPSGTDVARSAVNAGHAGETPKRLNRSRRHHNRLLCPKKPCITGWAKRGCLVQFVPETNRVTLLVTSPNIHGFKNNFTGRVGSKPFLIWLLTTPPHPKYAALVIYC